MAVSTHSAKSSNFGIFGKPANLPDIEKPANLRDIGPLRRHLSAAERERIEAIIEHLIELLDANDGDSEGEPDSDDEPSIGAALVWDELSRRSVHVFDGELDEADAEPWLGWSDWEAKTEDYQLLAEPDLEDEVSREIDDDFEHSLGWPESFSQGAHVEDLPQRVRMLYDVGLLTDNFVAP